MTKFLLGVAVGYVLSDMIDELLGKAQTSVEKMPEPPVPSTNPPTEPPTEAMPQP